MQVINEYIIIDPIITNTTSSGIILNDTKIKNIGEIIAIDKSIKGLNVGDKVVFDEAKTITFTYDGREYLACKYQNIVCSLN